MGYKFTEVVEASAKYFDDILAAETWANKYALKAGPNDYRELTPDDMHKRLAKEFARIERRFGKTKAIPESVIYEALKGFKRIVPQGSPMTAIGNPFALMSASNCTVIAPPADDMADIMRVGTEMAQLMKRRAGVGLDLSSLRPMGTKVNNAALQSSGAYYFADYYSYIAKMIGQKGRQGALMITMDVLHPDSSLFATIKRDSSRVTGANLSLRITDEFMRAVVNKQKAKLRWPLTGDPQIVREVDAAGLFDIIVESAFKTGDPGLLMWDNILKNLPAHCYKEFKTISTNPCAEVPLSAYDSCRLISLCLPTYVREPFTNSAYFDFAEFKKDVELAAVLSDDLVELELELITKIRNSRPTKEERKLWHNMFEAARLGRRIGLGTHGLGDTLARLCIKYDTDEAHRTAHKIYNCLRNGAYETSIRLAKDRGAFPLWDWNKEKDCEFFKRMPAELVADMKKNGRRNVALLTNAPTGTVALMSKTTSGIEPIFRLDYTRRVKTHGNPAIAAHFTDQLGEKWHNYNITHPAFAEYCRINKKQPTEIPQFFTTSDKLDYKMNVKMLGVIQSYIDHGVSCTINMPKEATPAMVKQVYVDAWKSGMKGVTVYVEGSRSGVLVSDDGITTASGHLKRPRDIPCEIHMTTCQGKRWLVIVGLVNGRPYEVFAGKAADLPMPRDITQAIVRKMGRHQYAIVYQEEGEEIFVPIKESFLESNGMLVRLLMNQCLRHEVPLEALYDTVNKAADITDFSRTVVRVIKQYMIGESDYRVKCANCGLTTVSIIGRCSVCTSCGHTSCS